MLRRRPLLILLLAGLLLVAGCCPPAVSGTSLVLQGDQLVPLQQEQVD